MYISKKYLKELRKHLCRGLFSESCGITYTAYFMWNTTKVVYYKFDEGVTYSIKIQKTTHSDIKGKSAF